MPPRVRWRPKAWAMPKSSTLTWPPSHRNTLVDCAEVAVDHARGMGVGQPPGHVGPDAQRLPGASGRGALQAFTERHAAEQLQHEVRPLLAPAHVVQRDEVRVRQPAMRLRLAEQQLAGPEVEPRPGLQRLERDRTAQLPIASLVDHAETPAADSRTSSKRPTIRPGWKAGSVSGSVGAWASSLSRAVTAPGATMWARRCSSSFGTTGPLAVACLRSLAVGAWRPPRPPRREGGTSGSNSGRDAT